jgi:antitoxin (DNA-binding transcriptional repressor) of toxin-antitoxin stability system
MKHVEQATATRPLSEYLDDLDDGPLIVTHQGKSVAVLMALKDQDELGRLLMAHSPKLQAILDDSRQSIAAGQGIPHDQFWREVVEN